jgi:hypothetical protein
MKCLASIPRFQDKKIKLDITNDALEPVLVTTAYVLITQFKMSVDTTKRLLEKIEYHAGIMGDKEEPISFQDYKDILKEEYDFVLDLSKVKIEEPKSKGIAFKSVSLKNSVDYVLTLVAYLLLDKLGLKQERVQTIMKRIMFYSNAGIKNESEVKRMKETLKNQYDCNFGFKRR